MDIFDVKGIKPMLIRDLKKPFNSPDYLYELKLDGIRCIAYLDVNSTDLRNKRDMKLLPRFPELIDINKYINKKCILDGELVVLKNGVPDFYEVQKRSIMTDSFKIQLAYSKYPASFVAYDVIYLDNKEVTNLELIERKKLLENVITESTQCAISRYIVENGIELYELADKHKLEGIVAKRLSSKYWFGKETKDWIKFKRMADEDFIICGFIKKNPMSAILLGQYKGNKLVYKGSVSFGVRYNLLLENKDLIIDYSPFNLTPTDICDSEVIWLNPVLVCVVEYMPNTKNSLRQPVFKGIRDDVLPQQCQVKT